MALVVADRVQETTTTTGTGTITLAGAVAGYQSFAVIGNANTTYYCITSGTAWEVGIGTYTAAGTTLARTTILASSASGAAITLAGTSNVFCVYPASKAVDLDENGRFVIGGSSDGTLTIANPVIQVAGTTAATSSLSGTNWGTSTVSAATLLLNKSKSGTIGTRTAVASGDTLGIIYYSGDDGTNFIRAAAITGQADGTPATNSMPGRLVFSTTASGASTPTERMRISSNGLITNSGYLLLAQGTATAGQAPLKFQTGTNLGTAEAGAVEYNGNVFFATENTTVGRGALSSYNVYQQTANGTTTTAATIADFFPANSSISLAAATLYEIECWCYFLKTTAGTVTFTMAASSAPTWMNGYYIASGITGINVAAAPTTGWTGSAGATTAAWAATGSLTTAVNHGFRFKIQILTNLATNWRMRYTSNTGTTQSLIGSYYTVRAVPASTGAFVA